MSERKNKKWPTSIGLSADAFLIPGYTKLLVTEASHQTRFWLAREDLCLRSAVAWQRWGTMICFQGKKVNKFVQETSPELCTGISVPPKTIGFNTASKIFDPPLLSNKHCRLWNVWRSVVCSHVGSVFFRLWLDVSWYLLIVMSINWIFDHFSNKDFDQLIEPEIFL